jgi:hypothetical protein
VKREKKTLSSSFRHIQKNWFQHDQVISIREEASHGLRDLPFLGLAPLCSVLHSAEGEEGVDSMSEDVSAS